MMNKTIGTFNQQNHKTPTKVVMIQALLFFFILSGTGIIAQPEMLIGHLSGRFVVRENFDDDGAFLNKQTFNSGKLISKNGYYEIEVITELFDEEKKSTNKYTTTYRCKPNESSVMVMAFPFSNPKSKEVGITTTTINFKELYDLKNLADVEIEMSFDTGLLNFFGSKNTIKIYDRTLEVDKDLKIIRSKIYIQAFAWGIRIKQLNYTVLEKLNDNGLLTFQKFTEADGSNFTMTYK